MREEHGGSAYAAAGRRELGEQLRAISRLLSRGKARQKKRSEGQNSEGGSGLRPGFSIKRWGWREAAPRSGRSEAGCGGGAGASGLLACEVEDLTAWTVTLHGLIMFSRKGFIFLSVVLMGLLLFGLEGRGSGSFFPLINFNPRRAIRVLNDWIFLIRC